MSTKIIFSTYCDDHLQDRFGTKKLVSTFRHFNPEEDIVVYGSKDIKRVHEENGVDLSNALPYLMLDAKNNSGADYVCHLDSDSLVLGSLDGILKMDYDVCSSLNNADNEGSDERQNRPRELWDLPNRRYVSCGCLCTNSELFLMEWAKLNQQIVDQFGGVKSFWMCDQNMMNILFHGSNLRNKILDPLDGCYYYGASANSDEGDPANDPPHIIKEWGLNTWKSWKDIHEKDGSFFLGGKIVKILHQSGGGNKDTAVKLDYSMFNPNVGTIIKEIVNKNRKLSG